MKTHIISVRVTDKTFDWLAKKAKKAGKPISSMVNEIIEGTIMEETLYKKKPDGR